MQSGNGSTTAAPGTYTSTDITMANAAAPSNADIQFYAASASKVATIVSGWRSNKVYIMVDGAGTKYSIQSTSAPTSITGIPPAMGTNTDLSFGTSGATVISLGSGFTPTSTFTDPA